MSKENNLTDFLTDVADAIREKKGTADKINPQNFSDEINKIPSSDEVIAAKAVTFYDCDGRILYTYTKEEFLALTEMPPLPYRKGMICQEWNWESYIDKTIEVGFITLHNGNLWRARQTHTALVIYPPSIDTAALYEVIVESHDGSIDDPIPYKPPMEIFKDKYYTQYGVKYYCTRDSKTVLSHDLSSLVGIYVELNN